MTFDEWWSGLNGTTPSNRQTETARVAFAAGRFWALREAAEVARKHKEAQFDAYQVYMHSNSTHDARKMQQGYHVASLIASAIERMGETK